MSSSERPTVQLDDEQVTCCPVRVDTLCADAAFLDKREGVPTTIATGTPGVATRSFERTCSGKRPPHDQHLWSCRHRKTNTISWRSNRDC